MVTPSSMTAKAKRGQSPFVLQTSIVLQPMTVVFQSSILALLPPKLKINIHVDFELRSLLRKLHAKAW